jgi:hypothetical protein
MGEVMSFALNRSVLLRKRMTEDWANQLLRRESGESASAEGIEQRLEWPSSNAPRVGDALEETGSLVHAVDIRVLVQGLIVLGDGDEEDEDVDVLEAVDPVG